MYTIDDIYSGSRRQPLPPPPPQNSYSSSLSPLAPPFVHPYNSLPTPQPPTSSQFLSAAAAATDWPSFASTGPFLSVPRSNGAVADPYFSHYYPELAPAGAMEDGFKNQSVYGGVDCGQWDGPFDEDLRQGKGVDPLSSWMDPSSSYKVSSFEKGLPAESHGSYKDNSYGVWNEKYCSAITGEVHSGLENSEWLHENHEAINAQNFSSPYSISSAPFSVSNSFREGMSYSDLPRSSSDMDPCNSLGSNSSYDRYMAQPDSSFANSFTFYSARACPTSSQQHSLSNVKATSMKDYSLRIGDHMASYLADETANIIFKEKDAKINQDSPSKAGNVVMNAEDAGIGKGAHEFADFRESLSSAKKGASESSMSLSTGLNSELNLKDLTITIDPSGISFAEPDSSMKFFPEALDKLNLVVDSPCWRGASTSRQPRLTVGETEVTETKVKESNDGNGSNQNNKVLENILQLGTMFLEKNKTKFSSEMPESVNLSDLHQKSEDDNKGAESAKDENRNQIFCGNIYKKLMNEVMEHKKIDTEPQDIDNARFVQNEGIAANKLQPADGIVDLEIGSPSLSRGKMLVREIHSASVDLLSAECSNGIKLEECDIKLLWSAYSNIFLVLQDKKAWLDCAWPPHVCSKNNGITQSNTTCNMKKCIHSMESKKESNEVDNSATRGGDTNYRKVDVTTNAFEKKLAKDFSEKDESSQILLYKNLWAEAEVANCKLKYDLQVARMKISEIESRKHQSRGELAQLTTPSSSRSTHNLDGHDTPVKARERLFGDHEDLEASVMARFKILKGRTIDQNPRSMNEQDIVIDSEEEVCSAAKQIPVIALADDDANDAVRGVLLPYLADLGFTESIADPYAGDEPKAWSSLVMPRPNVQSLGARYTETVEPAIDASGNTDAQEFLSSTSGQSMSYTTKSTGNWSHAIRHRSPSFEWEHVQKEEFALG